MPRHRPNSTWSLRRPNGRCRPASDHERDTTRTAPRPHSANDDGPARQTPPDGLAADGLPARLLSLDPAEGERWPEHDDRRLLFVRGDGDEAVLTQNTPTR